MFNSNLVVTLLRIADSNDVCFFAGAWSSDSLARKLILLDVFSICKLTSEIPVKQ